MFGYRPKDFEWEGFSICGPVRAVRVKAYWIAETELTNAQADAAIPAKRQAAALDDNEPMCGRSYDEIQNLIVALSKRDGLNYKLPTEEQWECAARGGLDQAEYPWGDEPPYGRSQIESLKPCKVKSFPPNSYGLCECSGNVSELVRDEYEDIVTDPNEVVTPGPPMRLVKGGSYSLIYNPVASRDVQLPDKEFWYDVGVRLMLEDSENISAHAKWETIKLGK